jgi:hypothetical protein
VAVSGELLCATAYLVWLQCSFTHSSPWSKNADAKWVLGFITTYDRRQELQYSLQPEVAECLQVQHLGCMIFATCNTTAQVQCLVTGTGSDQHVHNLATYLWTGPDIDPHTYPGSLVHTWHCRPCEPVWQNLTPRPGAAMCPLVITAAPANASTMCSPVNYDYHCNMYTLLVPTTSKSVSSCSDGLWTLNGREDSSCIAVSFLKVPLTTRSRTNSMESCDPTRGSISKKRFLFPTQQAQFDKTEQFCQH